MSATFKTGNLLTYPPRLWCVRGYGPLNKLRRPVGLKGEPVNGEVPLRGPLLAVQEPFGVPVVVETCLLGAQRLEVGEEVRTSPSCLFCPSRTTQRPVTTMSKTQIHHSNPPPHVRTVTPLGPVWYHRTLEGGWGHGPGWDWNHHRLVEVRPETHTQHPTELRLNALWTSFTPRPSSRPQTSYYDH